MNKKHIYISDSDIDKELSTSLKNRSIDQKFIYVWDGAETFYSAFSQKNKHSQDFNAKVFKEIVSLVKPNKKNVIISLWCWNGFQEEVLLSDLEESEYNFDYIWVDYSREMIDLADENLKDIKLDKTYVCADFAKNDFRGKINLLTEEYDSRFFVLLWYTFGNPSQTLISDSLYNILWEDDYLIMDCLTRDENKDSTTLALFERYSKFLNDENIANFRFTSLRRLWFLKEKWRFILKTHNEESLWSVVFSYYFECNNRVVITFMWEKYHVLPWEEIYVYSIRNYNLKRLEKFMEAHELNQIHKRQYEINEFLTRTLFLFKRK